MISSKLELERRLRKSILPGPIESEAIDRARLMELARTLPIDEVRRLLGRKPPGKKAARHKVEELELLLIYMFERDLGKSAKEALQATIDAESERSKRMLSSRGMNNLLSKARKSAKKENLPDGTHKYLK